MRHDEGTGSRRRELVRAGGVTAVTVTLILVFCGFPLSIWYHLSRQFYDCNTRPSIETFARYFGPAPREVRDVRATGHIGLGGSEVYLRFRATDEAIATLTRGFRKLTGNGTRERLQNLAELETSSPHLRDQGRVPLEHRVDWGELRSVRSADVYVKPHPHAGVEDIMIVDRERGIVYYYHWNQ